MAIPFTKDNPLGHDRRDPLAGGLSPPGGVERRISYKARLDLNLSLRAEEIKQRRARIERELEDLAHGRSGHMMVDWSDPDVQAAVVAALRNAQKWRQAAQELDVIKRVFGGK